MFGLRFSRDYLRFVWHAGRHWGDTGAGVLKMLGYRVEYFNQSHALFLVHEIFVDGAYTFASKAACPRIVDCGANIGLSIIFFKALHPGADIVAFEPDPVTFARLKDTMNRNGLGDVRLVNAAVAEEEKAMTLYRGKDDAGSIVSSLDPGWGGPAGESVPAVRLSNTIQAPIDLLKLDVEGAEYGVIRDLVATGAIAHVREAIIEFHQLDREPDGVDQMVRTLQACGMQIRHGEAHLSPRIGLIHARRVQ